jgi:hypothetical protein
VIQKLFNQSLHKKSSRNYKDKETLLVQASKPIDFAPHSTARA